jgi:hypothetical protein
MFASQKLEPESKFEPKFGGGQMNSWFDGPDSMVTYDQKQSLHSKVRLGGRA